MIFSFLNLNIRLFHLKWVNKDDLLTEKGLVLWIPNHLWDTKLVQGLYASKYLLIKCIEIIFCELHVSENPMNILKYFYKLWLWWQLILCFEHKCCTFVLLSLRKVLWPRLLESQTTSNKLTIVVSNDSILNILTYMFRQKSMDY